MPQRNLLQFMQDQGYTLVKSPTGLAIMTNGQPTPAAHDFPLFAKIVDGEQDLVTTAFDEDDAAAEEESLVFSISGTLTQTVGFRLNDDFSKIALDPAHACALDPSLQALALEANKLVKLRMAPFKESNLAEVKNVLWVTFEKPHRPDGEWTMSKIFSDSAVMGFARMHTSFKWL